MTDPPRPQREAFPPELPPTRRYTLAQEPSFEDQVQQDLARLGADAEVSLATYARALLLVGRFARGEGSVISKTGEPHAYPGYHCLAIVDRITPTGQNLIAELEQTWTGHLRTQVHIKACSLSTLTHPPRSLWWLDVGNGGAQLLSGNPQVMKDLPRSTLSDLPSDEVGWLLTEHATYLATALENHPLGDHSETIPPIYARAHAMALACGDAEQLLTGEFSLSLVHRYDRLTHMAVPGPARSLYKDALSFLERPDLWQPKGDRDRWLEDTLAALCHWHLDLEQRRTQAPTDLRQYVRYRGHLFASPSTKRSWRSRWLSTGPRPLSFPYVGEVRERLARAAAALAYGRREPAARLMAERLLLPNNRAAWSPSLLGPALQTLHAEARSLREEPADESFYV